MMRMTTRPWSIARFQSCIFSHELPNCGIGVSNYLDTLISSAPDCTKYWIGKNHQRGFGGGDGHDDNQALPIQAQGVLCTDKWATSQPQSLNGLNRSRIFDLEQVLPNVIGELALDRWSRAPPPV